MDHTELPPEQIKLYNLLTEVIKAQSEGIKKQFQETVTSRDENVNKELEILKKRCIFLERKFKKNNIIIYGLPKINETHKLLKHTLKVLNESLGTSISAGDINNIYKVGQSENPPVILEFATFLKKITLFQDKKKLKNLKETGITINNELCVEDREENKILRYHLKNARAQNHEAKIVGYKLIINGDVYTAKELEDLEAEEEIEIEELNEEENINKNKNAQSGKIRNINIKNRPIDISEQKPNQKKQKLEEANSRNRRRISYSPKTRNSKKT